MNQDLTFHEVKFNGKNFQVKLPLAFDTVDIKKKFNLKPSKNLEKEISDLKNNILQSFDILESNLVSDNINKKFIYSFEAIQIKCALEKAEELDNLSYLISSQPEYEDHLSNSARFAICEYFIRSIPFKNPKNEWKNPIINNITPYIPINKWCELTRIFFLRKDTIRQKYEQEVEQLIAKEKAKEKEETEKKAKLTLLGKRTPPDEYQFSLSKKIKTDLDSNTNAESQYFDDPITVKVNGDVQESSYPNN
jgi:hypothetical protein